MKINRSQAYHFTALMAIASVCIHIVRAGHLKPPLGLMEFMSMGYILLFLLPGMIMLSLLLTLLMGYAPSLEIEPQTVLAVSALAGMPLMWYVAGILAEYGCKKHILATYVTFTALVLLFAFTMSIWQALSLYS